MCRRRESWFIYKNDTSCSYNRDIKKGQNPPVEFSIFNSSNNGTYFHVTHHISIEKGGQTLLNEWFHHHYGDLKLEINPKSTTRTIIYAQKDPVLDMYTGTLDTPVVV